MSDDNFGREPISVPQSGQSWKRGWKTRRPRKPKHRSNGCASNTPAKIKTDRYTPTNVQIVVFAARVGGGGEGAGETPAVRCCPHRWWRES